MKKLFPRLIWLFLPCAFLFSEIGFAKHPVPSFRYMVRRPGGAPARCSITRIGHRTLATASHCTNESVSPALAAHIEINTELVGRWLTVEAQINPEFRANLPSNQLISDVSVITVREEDVPYISNAEIYPPCADPPSTSELLLGSAQWSRALFEGHLQPMLAVNYLIYFPVDITKNRQVLGVIEEESGGGLFKWEGNDQLCWLGALSTKKPSPDFSTGGTYSGQNALNWVRPQVK